MKNTKNDKNANQPTRTRRDNGAGSITLRKDGRWMGSIQYGYKADGKPKRITVYGKTQQEVKRKLREKSEEFIKNDGNIILAKSVKDWFTEWLYQDLSYLKAKSFDAVERTINNFIIPAFGYMQINQLTNRDVQRLINDTANKGYSLSQLQKIKNVLSKKYKLGIQCKEVTVDPTIGVQLPFDLQAEENAKSVSAMSTEEIKLLVEQAYKKFPNGTRIYPRGEIIVFLLNTGLRFGEAAALTWDDVDFEKRTITVNKGYVTVINRDKKNVNPKTLKPYATTLILQNSPKSSRSNRVVPLNNDAFNALTGILKYNKKYELVCANANGNPPSASNLNRTLKYMLNQAGIENKYSIHSLRHTFATQLFRNHVDIEIISQLLGHADSATTYKVYIHIIQAEKIEAIGSLDFMK